VEQVTFCHVPEGNDADPVTITASSSVYDEEGHQNHLLDYMGVCIAPNIGVTKTVN
jgi:hypothetical protein